MIKIKNSQRKINVNTTKLQKDAHKLLRILNYADFDLGIWLTTNKTIQEYNTRYRNKNKPTDILSFAYYPDLKSGEKIIPQTEDDKNLGDLIISVEHVQNDAKRLHTTLEKRLEVLLVHGISHLLGYTHDQEDEDEKMQDHEAFLLKQLKN